MKHKILFIGIAIAILVVIIGSSYAFLSSQSEGTKNHIVKAGKLEISFSDVDNSKINLENAYPIPDSEGMKQTPHTFTITNTGTLPLSYQISLEDNTNLYQSHNDTGKIFGENQLKLGITNGNGNTTYQMYTKDNFIEGTLDSGASATYTIRLWIPEHIGNEVQGFHFHANIKVDSVQTLGAKNQNITKVYTYNQESGSSTFCVTGEEETCQEITNTPATYETGTIIKYKVNDTEEKYFFVMFDNGDTLTLQQRENIVNNTPWYSSANDNTKGPLTILPVLEEAVSTWNNVNDLTYALGTTVFKDNAYTGCINSQSCDNKYTLSNRTAKARMITLQEVVSFGCRVWTSDGSSSGSCPVWMHNYLIGATQYGGTEENSTIGDVGYWTNTIYYGSGNGDGTNRTWIVNGLGYFGHNNTSGGNNNGARAVIEINKLDKDAIQTVPRNENILAIFKYNQSIDSSTFCVTGEEPTCEQILETPTTYEVGTIIKYKVNDSEAKYFHVMYDNGRTLTMQQRENTVYQTAWYSTADNTKGPLTILPVLEEATKDWTNVLDQSYTLGTTVFIDDAYTGCSNLDRIFTCISNTYTLNERTAKARLITIKEAGNFGCLRFRGDGTSNKSCPVWMYNYLSNSTSYGGTVNQAQGEYGNNYGYWTSSADKYNSTAAWYIFYPGSGHNDNITSTNLGARAVVVINK